MKDCDDLFRCLEEYIDKYFEQDFIPFNNDLFNREMENEEIKNIFEPDFLDRMKETADAECCCAAFKTLCRTIFLCREMNEMDVPEDIHEKLLKTLASELED
ncbi:MAG: hypothetical protein U9O97_06475 [Elusimicrobiota bacterium]|nr:hypothetical protein [Elusimicrobiota bacterium]